MESPKVSGGWCLGGEAPTLVNDGFFKLFWTWVRLPPLPSTVRSYMSEKTQNKIWITVGTFSTFEEADARRNNILNDHVAIKVRCDGRYRKSFRVRVWDPPQEKSKKKGNKNVNKKVRSRQKG